MAPDGFKLPFVTHTSRWPRLTSGPFRYKRYADMFLEFARRYTSCREAGVIAPSAISLMYPAVGLPGYSRDEFIADALHDHET